MAAAYRGAALMAKDSDALAYQAAALSETARGASFRRPDFLDRLWRLADLVLLTLAPLVCPVLFRFPGSAHPFFTHGMALWEGLPRRAGQRNLKSRRNVLNYLELSFAALRPVCEWVPDLPAAAPPAPISPR
jgi:hypothetical protein